MKCTSFGSSYCGNKHTVLGDRYACYIYKKTEYPQMAGSVHSLPMLHQTLLLYKAVDTLGNLVFSDLEMYVPTLTLSYPERCSLSLASVGVSPGKLSQSDMVAYPWGKCQEAGYAPETNCRELCSFAGPGYYTPGEAPSKGNTEMENGKERGPPLTWGSDGLKTADREPLPPMWSALLWSCR